MQSRIWIHILGQYSVMGGPIDLKFSGGIPGSTGIIRRGLLEMCMIHFKAVDHYCQL